MTGTRWNKVAIIGVGVMGGSIGRALLERELCAEVVGVGRDPQRLENARRAGIVSNTSSDIRAAARGADVVVACTPVDRIVASLLEAAETCPATSLLTDVGSTKQSIVHQLLQSLPPSARFVGSHPMAGSEKSGFEFARADLFRGRLVVLTPTPETPADVLSEATTLWQALGARTVSMSAERHDRGVAWVSHLPHAVAAVVSGCTPDEYLHLAASGWRDTTRVAAGDPGLWTQIFNDNRIAVLETLQQLEGRLREFRESLASGNHASLERQLTAGKQKRDAVAD